MNGDLENKLKFLIIWGSMRLIPSQFLALINYISSSHQSLT